MITELEIKNFQSHKNSLLEFVPGMNVIIGESDSGKSAIIRALRWAIYGQPRGDAFRSWWGGDTEVTISTPTHHVRRVKTNSQNQYLLQEIATENELEFNAIGTDIPDEVVEALNMEELNLQKQGDNFFLISDTPGAVASHFNHMANLEKIDSSLKYIQSEIRSKEQGIKGKESTLDGLKTDLKTFDYLEDAETDLEALEGLKALLVKKKEDMQVLLNLKTNIERLTSEIIRKSKALKALPLITTCIQGVKDIEKKNKQYDILDALAVNWERNTEKQKVLNENLAALPLLKEALLKYDEAIALHKKKKQAQTTLTALIQVGKDKVGYITIFKAKGQVEACLGLIKEFDEKDKKSYTLEGVVLALKDKALLIQTKKEEVALYNKEYETALHEMKLCPICNNKIK